MRWSLPGLRTGRAAHISTNILVPKTIPKTDAAFIILRSDRAHVMSGSNAICVTTLLQETSMVPMREPGAVFTPETPVVSKQKLGSWSKNAELIGYVSVGSSSSVATQAPTDGHHSAPDGRSVIAAADHVFVNPAPPITWVPGTWASESNGPIDMNKEGCPSPR